MKKIIALLLVAVLSLSLVACGGKEVAINEQQQTRTESDKIENGQLVIENRQGILSIDAEKLLEILEYVELTTENWRDYIKVFSYDEETVSRDEFGDIVATETTTYHRLGAGTERYYQFENAIIELKHKETGEMNIYHLEEVNECIVSEDFNLDDYECTRIKGDLFFLDIPEEVLHSPLPDWDYECGFIIVVGYDELPYRVNKDSKEIVFNNNSFANYLE